MKVKAEVVCGNSMVGHLIIYALSETFKTDKTTERLADFMKDAGYLTNEGMEVKLMIAEKEFDIVSFCEQWQSQVEKAIKQEAKIMVDDMLAALDQTIADIRKTIDKEVCKRLGIAVDVE